MLLLPNTLPIPCQGHPHRCITFASQPTPSYSYFFYHQESCRKATYTPFGTGARFRPLLPRSSPSGRTPQNFTSLLSQRLALTSAPPAYRDPIRHTDNVVSSSVSCIAPAARQVPSPRRHTPSPLHPPGKTTIRAPTITNPIYAPLKLSQSSFTGNSAYVYALATTTIPNADLEETGVYILDDDFGRLQKLHCELACDRIPFRTVPQAGLLSLIGRVGLGRDVDNLGTHLWVGLEVFNVEAKFNGSWGSVGLIQVLTVQEPLLTAVVGGHKVCMDHPWYLDPEDDLDIWTSAPGMPPWTQTPWASTAIALERQMAFVDGNLKNLEGKRRPMLAAAIDSHWRCYSLTIPLFMVVPVTVLTIFKRPSIRKHCLKQNSPRGGGKLGNLNQRQYQGFEQSPLREAALQGGAVRSVQFSHWKSQLPPRTESDRRAEDAGTAGSHPSPHQLHPPPFSKMHPTLQFAVATLVASVSTQTLQIPPPMPANWPSTDQTIAISGALLKDPLVADALAYVTAKVPAATLAIKVSTPIQVSWMVSCCLGWERFGVETDVLTLGLFYRHLIMSFRNPLSLTTMIVSSGVG
ncbi:hypothetical protein BDK51DRAFT_37874 [Blyttiomyces helicus]|uniref:Uncharacterized protein n=1 Tax=Blyttiomyces helicus TaxID=388810 RepID=A0A4P9W8R4_9FUNG|nr:hypothetical protein BDK51DRAFT_37874 [Blyttiomyces helicus]|eukprot:RKO86556.1 hypothetical protein BDK51DRAFT_37874 [Blyttiomyces helicus]